jgi:hypothetical protein
LAPMDKIEGVFSRIIEGYYHQHCENGRISSVLSVISHNLYASVYTKVRCDGSEGRKEGRKYYIQDQPTRAEEDDREDKTRCSDI